MARKRRFDVFVMGTGPAGGIVASLCRKAGLSVAVADNRPYGGTCPLRGCEPKKVLADAAATVERLRNAAGHGVTGRAAIDWAGLMAFKRSFTEAVPGQVKRHFQNLGIATFDGQARFTGPGEAMVGDETVEAGHFCIATGARPRHLDFPGAERVITSTRFFDLESLPGRMVFLGGGFISFELAHIAAVAGAQTAIVYRGARMLRLFDPDLAEKLMGRMRELGVALHTGLAPHSLAAGPDGLVLRAGPGGDTVFAADAVVHGMGRVPDVAGLGLEAAGVELDQGAVAVNAFMQSVSNPAVYAAGDAAAGGLPLTPVASLEAETAAHNIIHGPSSRIDYQGIPSVLFTYPPLAGVGLLEEQARAQGLDVEVRLGDSSGWSEYERLGQRCAGYKLVLEKGGGRLLGAHVLGDGAEEVVNLLALAMRRDVGVQALGSMLWTYPSFGYTLRYMLQQ